MTTFILFVLILGVTVLVHECGHFLFAKLTGVKVFEFSIGMGPKLVQKTAKDGTKYSIRWIPIGGYVSLAGEELEDLKTHKGETLQDKKAWQRFLVMFMGVGFNFIFAFIVLFFVGIIFGAQDLKPIITHVEPNYPAYQAGLTDNDKILAINNKKVTYTDDVSLYLTLANLNKEVTFKVEKENGSIKEYKVTPERVISKDGNESYKIGINLNDEKGHGFINSIVYAFKKECAIFKQMFVVLGNLVTGGLSVNQLSGPVGIYSIVGQVKAQGLNALLCLVALLSINVGVINILPFPAFDGGRIFLLLVEKIKGSPVSPKVENTINSVGFILLILLMIYVTINDIIRLF